MMRISIRHSVSFVLLLCFVQTSYAQNIQPTTAEERQNSLERIREMRSSSVFWEYPVRSVGPTVQSARVTDIAVLESNPRIFYVAYASSGVFKTTNSGNTMEPVFDNQGALTIGDIAISRADENLIWVGTGENNSSRSSYAGSGVYKSEDGGETWQHTGLTGTQHIGRIITHPSIRNTAWTASQGPLYSMNEHRGVYKTTDGGKTWRKTLTPPDSTGVIDLVIHPEDPNILWAAGWQRFRQAWNFWEGGGGSAIWKSTDGGETWKKTVDGFPQGDFVGRIGLDVSRSNPEIIYTLLDNQYETKTEREVSPDQLTQSDFMEMSKKEFLALDNERLNRFLRQNRFPEKYTARSVKNDVEQGIYEPKAIAEFIGDANAALFNTSIVEAEVYRSENGGESWEKVNSYPLTGLYNTYGYYFGEIRISPSDPDVVYILGVPLLKSTDGGKTWKGIAENQPVHVDHHAMWIDPSDPEHLLLGNDGGLYESHDGGENFIHHDSPVVGQFYTIAVDMEEPYNVYGGLQDNGVMKGSSRSVPNRPSSWESIMGGDGMHVQVDPRNSDIVYTGFQFGNYFRLDLSDGRNSSRITPRHEVGEPRYRYNWNTPIEMSTHNPDIIYFGSQRLNRSMDRGETWEKISPDLTHDLPNGDVPYSTITSISESPLRFGLIWVGTDDGNIQLTRDGGVTWTNVSRNLPQRRWVPNVHTSEHDPAVAYAALNGYRYDEFKTYLYKTSDYGKTWRSVKGNLPDDVANYIVQDPKVPEILYAGLDHGTFVSFDDGNEWHTVTGIPNVSSYALVVHPRDLDLVVGTHGRSVYVMDLEPIHEVHGRMGEPVIAVKPESVRHSSNWGQSRAQYRDPFEPEVRWLYWLNDKKADGRKVTITVKDSKGNTVIELADSGSYGFNRFHWNLKLDDSGYLGKGTYTIVFRSGNNTDEVSFEVN